MIAASGYKSKKALKESIGKPLRYQETSYFTEEFKPNGKNALVGPSAYKRVWYAQVTCENGIITKVV